MEDHSSPSSGTFASNDHLEFLSKTLVKTGKKFSLKISANYSTRRMWGKATEDGMDGWGENAEKQVIESGRYGSYDGTKLVKMFMWRKDLPW